MRVSRAAVLVVLSALMVSSGSATRQILESTPAPAPSSCLTVAATAQSAGLSTLLAAAQAAGLAVTLSQPSLAYTVFAPTNEAFDDVLVALNVTSQELLASPQLGDILRNHLVPQPLLAATLLSQGLVTTVLGTALNITQATIGNETIVEVSTPLVTANVVLANVSACQSIVYVVDAVLVPETLATSS